MWRLLRLTILAVPLASPALADQVAVDLDIANSIIWGSPNAGISHGWEFTVNQTIEVTHLGMVDVGPAGYPPGLNQDGFQIAHPLGIFRISDGALLTSGAVSPGTGDELIGYARYVPVPHVLLTPGESYVMTMYSATADFPQVDFISIWMSAISPAPEINYVVGRYSDPSAELKLPENIHGLPNAFFGPNFLFVVPEPAGILLMAIAGVLIRRRR
jgi:hypothetical protein